MRRWLLRLSCGVQVDRKELKSGLLEGLSHLADLMEACDALTI